MEDDPIITSTQSIHTPYGEQDENGTDLSIIRHNLQLTPTERLLQGEGARIGAIQLREYGRLAREKSASANR